MRLDDLKGDTCLWCDEPLPDERRLDQVYCSKRCGKAHYSWFESEAIRESKQGRTCAQCGQPMSTALQASAMYCSAACGHIAAAARRLPPGRPCAWCGKPVPAHRLYALTCSERCRRASAAAHRPARYSNRPTIPCAWCGESFLQKKNSNTYCCRSCAARARCSRKFSKSHRERLCKCRAGGGNATARETCQRDRLSAIDKAAASSSVARSDF